VNIFKLVIILIAITLSNISYAHQPAEGKVFGTFGPFVNHTQSIYTPEANTPFNPGFGILAEGDLSDHGGIEIGLFVSQKDYKREFGSNGLVMTRVERIDIPMGYRYWLIPELSAALEFDSAFSVGDPSFLYSNVTGDQSTTANTVAEYGIEFSIQYEFWTNQVFSLLADGRYTLSVSANPGEDANVYGLMLALKYLIQEKSPEKAPEKDYNRTQEKL
jgi:hypothetical protein